LRREAVMMAKRRDVDPALALRRAQQWSRVLASALAHPAVDKSGRLRFKPDLEPGLLRELGNDPISRSGMRCRRVPKEGAAVDLDEIRKILATLPGMIRKGAGGLSR
jgi:hypothetical protein